MFTMTNGIGVRRPAAQIRNHRRGALLRPRRERPRRCRAAEKRDEFTPSKANAHMPSRAGKRYRGRIARLKPVVLTFQDAGQGSACGKLTVLDTLPD